MNNILQTVASQYANSPTLLALINTFNEAIDPSADIDNIVTHILQVDTAQGFGLDICGRIVRVTRTIATNPATVLTDDQFRELILLKALANISRATAYSINTLLIEWMGDRGRAYVNDLGNMEIVYNFEFSLEPFEITIITESGIFLRPAGVGGWMVQYPNPVFGFSGMEDASEGFGQATFMPKGNPYQVA